MLQPMAPCPTVDVLHLDDALIVVDKPAGVLAVPGRGEAGRDNLAVRVQAQFANALVVHRLDMATSGVMLFARGAVAQRQLSMAFASGEVAKQYVAIVEGRLQGDSGVIDAPLAADWPHRPRQVVDFERGKPSLTHWRVLERAADSTRLLLEPATGRTHQLRVHLQWLGHPIRGDALYATAAAARRPPAAARDPHRPGAPADRQPVPLRQRAAVLIAAATPACPARHDHAPRHPCGSSPSRPG